MSTLRVDTIATRTGSGNITASNTIAGNLTGNVTGNVTGNLTGNSTVGGTLGVTGNTTITSGNLVIATAGNGIDFSAASGSAGGSSSALLDDYEEGTWTANLIGSTSNPTTAATSAAATYTKIGRLVYARWMIGPANVAGASGGIRVNGLPFNNAGGHVSGNVMLYYRKSTPYTDAINLTPYVSGNQVYLYLTRDGYADVWAEILFDLTGASTNFYMYASVVYETA